MVRARAMDDLESRLGWVGGFLDGGVVVMGVPSGVDIYPPEEVDDRPGVSPAELQQIEEVKRSSNWIDPVR
ncbi:hypothetical protein GCM10027456_55610 [Kineosporia babensis]